MRAFLKIISIIFTICILVGIYAHADEGNKIRIGMSAAFSGPSRDLGYELYNGMNAYFEHVNGSGGINGNRIELIAFDDGYDPIPAINNTLSLIDDERVFLLVGYVGTPTVTRVLPLLKLFENRDIYLFFPFTGAEPQRKPPYDEFVFNLRPSYEQETAGLVQKFTQAGRSKIAVFYQADAYGRSGWDGVRKELGKHGLKIVGEATYKRGEEFSSSFDKQVEIIKRSNPDAVISIGAYEASAGFIRDAREGGLNVPIANVSFVGSESMLDLLLQEGERKGKDFTLELINSEVVPNFLDDSIPAVRQYKEIMSRYTSKTPPTLIYEDDQNHFPDGSKEEFGFIGFEGFLNAKLLTEVLRRLGDQPDKSKIAQTVKSISGYDIGIGEKVSFEPEDNQGLSTVYFNTVKNGRFVPIKDWSKFKK